MSRFIIFCFILISLPCAFGQSGLIQGVIVDPADAVIPNAKISVWDDAKGIMVRETVSGPDGSFQLRQLLLHL